MHHFGSTRSSLKADHLLQTPDTFVRSPLPGAEGVEFILHAAPQLGARFTQMTAEFVAGGSLDVYKRQALCGWNDVPADAELFDFGDHVLLPGLVDSHVHINEPGRTEWEGFETATQAAASGGVTTLVDMPLNCIPETIDVPALEAKRAAAQGKAWVDLSLIHI